MNCKPGDLAIIVGSTYPIKTPGIEGRVVEIFRAHVSGEQFISEEGIAIHLDTLIPCWIVRSSRLLPWLSNGGAHAGKILMMQERPIPDAALRLIGGVPVHDEATEDLKEPA